jgi:hypothetical protein
MSTITKEQLDELRKAYRHPENYFSPKTREP